MCALTIEEVDGNLAAQTETDEIRGHGYTLPRDDYLREIIRMVLGNDLALLGNSNTTIGESNEHAWLVDKQSAGSSLYLPILLLPLLYQFLVLLSIGSLFVFQLQSDVFSHQFCGMYLFLLLVS